MAGAVEVKGMRGVISTLKVPFLSFIVALALLLYPYLKNWKIRRALSKITGPPPHGLILGNLPDIPADRSEEPKVFLKYTREFGKKGFFPFFMGPIPILDVVGPEAAREILSTSKHTQKNFMYDFFKPWLGEGLLISWGPKWKVRRRLITPAFHFDVLQRFLEVMNEQSDVLISRLHETVGEEKVNMFEFITACALDIICETAMGRKVNAQSAKRMPYVDAVFKMSGLIVDRIQNPLFMSDFIFSLTSKGKEYNKCLKELHEFTISVIKERQKFLESQQQGQASSSQKKFRPAFLDTLLTAEFEGKPLTIEDIREEVDTFMFEGHDTTSASLAWTVHLLAKYPEIQDRVQQELDDVIGGETMITSEMLSQLKYLENVAKESLRMFPSVPGIGRVTSEDIELDGCKIPKGTSVVVSIYCLHHNPYYWENPEEFNPDRWVGAEEKDPYLYVPFSAGSRNCIGQKFAQMEEKLILAKIFSNFRVTTTETDPKSVPELILRPTEGVWVNLERRRMN